MNNETEVSTEQALKVINLVQNAIGNSITGVSFFKVNGYRNEYGEIANHLINIGASYENAKKKDIEWLENVDLSQFDWGEDVAVVDEARRILIEAFIAPNKAQSDAQKDAYTHIISGVKVHNQNAHLYIYGYAVKTAKGEWNKTIIKQADQSKPKGAKPLTRAKNELRWHLRTGQFKMFKYEVKTDTEIQLVGGGDTLELDA